MPVTLKWTMDEGGDSSHCSDSDSEQHDLQVKIMSHFLMLDWFVVKLESFQKGRDVSLERETLEETRKTIDMVFELLPFTTSFVGFSGVSDCVKSLIRDLASCLGAIDGVWCCRNLQVWLPIGSFRAGLFTFAHNGVRVYLGKTGPKVLWRFDLIFFLLSYLGPLTFGFL